MNNFCCCFTKNQQATTLCVIINKYTKNCVVEKFPSALQITVDFNEGILHNHDEAAKNPYPGKRHRLVDY